MSRVKARHVAGVSLALLLAGSSIVQAQGDKPRLPSRIGLPGRTATTPPATGGQPGSQVGSSTTLPVGVLMPCCVVEGLENSLKEGSFLVVKDTKSGAKYRVKLSGTGKLGSSATSTKYRPGQTVDMNIQRTRLALTPFPIEDSKSNKINGNSSWKMWTDVTVSNNGRIDGKTRLKSAEALRGFTGGVEVWLTDRAGNVLHQTSLHTYGVNANSQRTERWEENVSTDVINKVRRVAIKHTYEPKNRFAASIGWLMSNGKDISVIVQCTIKYLGEEEGEERPPAGQAQNQPSPSGPTVLECAEAGQNVAEELGL